MASYEIFVTYKEGIFDPPGATAERALHNLGYEEVDSVRIGKFIRLETSDGEDGDAKVREMCARLLANPVIEDFRIERASKEA